jgi:phosphoribosyl 1,2-cyclic phosphodiesterase
MSWSKQMKVDILASGSKGNCIALTSGQTTILIDAGVAKTKIEKRLLEVGIRPDEVKGIFITHAHGDHIKGLPLANKYKIPVITTLTIHTDMQSMILSLKNNALSV